MADSRKEQQDREFARQGRNLALVIAGTGLIWVIFQSLIPALGITPRYAILIDLAALAAFIWSMVAAWRIWRRRRET